MTLKVDTLERHRGELPRLFLSNKGGGGIEVEQEERSSVVELRQDVWKCVKTTVYVRVCQILLNSNLRYIYLFFFFGVLFFFNKKSAVNDSLQAK
jgi:hypothetical protein